MSTQPSEALDSLLFRRACAKFATGVAVITTSEDGLPHGVTINSFTSVSLRPPLLLFCIDHRSRVLPVLRRQARCAVNILRADQEALSRQFAQPEGDRFDGTAWHWDTVGVPVLAGCLARFDVSMVQTLTAGDHDIFIVRTDAVEAHDGQPLLYFDSRYRTLAGL